MRRRITAAIILSASLGLMWSQSAGQARADKDGTPVITPIAERYRPAADRIMHAALAGNDAYNKLEHLCVVIGHRLSGSPALEEAIDWAVGAMKRDGQQDVHREKVMVPHWVRGNESAELISPRRQRLSMVGLGGSVGTPSEGITAPVLVVADEDELKAVADRVSGKIVVFNKAMPPYDPERGSGYGSAVYYRTHGARLAAEHGALACLIRSVTATSLGTPHTGAMRYGDASRKIPAAAITIEDAETLARLQQRGITPVVRLKMEAKTHPDAPSANVIGELRGSEFPDEVIVISGHLDSWDVGHGAHDDGGGCVMAMEAINVLRKLNMVPRRTIRVVLWTNEENGLRGGKAYAKEHADELANHVAAIEADSGVFKPKGYSLECTDDGRQSRAVEQMRDIVSVFSGSIGEMNIRTGGSGADISSMKSSGVVLLGHRVEGSTYFDYHHTHADTIDKIDPKTLSENVAVMATVAYILADMPERFGD